MKKKKWWKLGFLGKMGKMKMGQMGTAAMLWWCGGGVWVVVVLGVLGEK
jgi:hypothetical protein